MQRFIVASWLALCALSAHAQVITVTVGKQIQYLQTSATGVAIAADRPYEFFGNVRGPGPPTLAPPRLSGPIDWVRIACCWPSNGAMIYNTFRSRWDFSWLANTPTEISQIFPDGPYSILVDQREVILFLGNEVFPPAPVVSFGSNGRWAADGTYVFDPTRPLVISSGNYPGYGTHLEDRMRINFDTLGFEVLQLASAVPGPGLLTFTLPANTLASGQQTTVRVQFSLSTFVNPSAFPGSSNTTQYTSLTNVRLKAETPPQVFPMTVTSSIGATTSSATAQIQYLPQDVGTTGSVYVFAIAPSNRVVDAAQSKSAAVAWRAQGATSDTPVQCVLAQLNSTGQLQAVSASNLQAYVTGVLSAQGQAVTILNGVSTANIGGATFYVGYGPSASAMINNGINQRAVTVPAAISCDPSAPQTGWWWNAAEGGRGYSIEVAGRHVFFASYLYDVSGRATWLVASGNTSLDGSLFTGNLESYAQGQALAGAYRAPGPATNAGPVTLAFSDASHGTLTWPGGTLAIERFNIVPNGLTLAPQASQPESGWWWNPAESGRGFFLEWQGGELFMAGYMYDDAGNPIWYLGTNTTPSTNAQSFSANWWQFGSGQTLAGAYRPAQQVNANVAPVTIQFQGSENALMTLPGGRITALRRFRF